MMQLTTLQKLSILSLIVIFALLATVFIPPISTKALSGNQFRAGNIIDDGIFFNKSSMSVQQIQNFLNAKVPNCDTWGTTKHSSGQTRAQYGASKGNPAPFTCLRDYVQDTPSKVAENQLCGAYGGGRKSSAQIIYDVAQICGINPQVLLVLLQKEQSLVTDDWPWPIQYRSATGFGCPDTAPCDAEYYGFFNQVYNAGRIYKKYARDAAGYNYRAGRNNNILYNPNRACGSSNVYIQNQATAGLYVYTPYQPNQAALNNLYGTGDGCSAYGNRNFWRMFNDWFGSTHGSLIRTESSGALYYTDGERRFYVPSTGFMEQYGLSGGDVRFVSQSELNAIPIASGSYSDSLGYIAKASDSDTLYLVNNGSRIPISSMDAFNNFGFTPEMIKVFPKNVVERLSLSSKSLSNFIQASDLSIYKVENSKRRAIFELGKMNELIGSKPVTPLTNFNMSLWKYGTPLVDGNYVAIGPDGALRLYNGGQFNAVTSMAKYNCWNLGKIKTFRLSSLSITNGENKGTLTCFARDSSNQTYLMSNSARFKLNTTSNIQPSSAPDSAITRLPLKPMGTIMQSPNGELSVLEANTLHAVSSMQDFAHFGYTPANITKLSTDAYNSFQKGARKLAPGAPLVDNSGGVYVVSGNSSRLYIGSMKLFNDFKLRWPGTVPSAQKDLNAYPRNGSLTNYVKTSDGAYLIDGGKRYLIGESLDAAVGIARNSMPSVDNYLLRFTSPQTLSRFIKATNSSNIYYLENGKKKHIKSWGTYLQMNGGSVGAISTLTPERVNAFTNDSPLN